MDNFSAVVLGRSWLGPRTTHGLKVSVCGLGLKKSSTYLRVALRGFPTEWGSHGPVAKPWLSLAAFWRAPTIPSFQLANSRGYGSLSVSAPTIRTSPASLRLTPRPTRFQLDPSGSIGQWKRWHGLRRRSLSQELGQIPAVVWHFKMSHADSVKRVARDRPCRRWPDSVMNINLDAVTWIGPEPDDTGLAVELPRALGEVLSSINGFILRGGALHVRGMSLSPSWHSLRTTWRGNTAVSKLYPRVLSADIPFGQDCVGDQFLLRDDAVLRLSAETGDVDLISGSLTEFLEAACRAPIDFLQAQPLLAFASQGRTLSPGMCIHVYPPFCAQESEQGVSMRDVPSDELLHFHAQFAAGIRGVADGERIRIATKD